MGIFVTTISLLYVNLQMPFFAAFVAMLGKEWLNRYYYMRHAGESSVLKKWPFHLTHS